MSEQRATWMNDLLCGRFGHLRGQVIVGFDSVDSSAIVRCPRCGRDVVLDNLRASNVLMRRIGDAEGPPA